MGIGTDEFTADELALIPPPDDNEPQAATDDDATGADEQQQSAQPTVTEQKGEAQQAGDSNAVQEEDKPVSRQALRAARRSERVALQRLDAAERELQELRQRASQAVPATATDELSDTEIAELAQDIPAIGKLAASVKAIKQQLQTASAAAQKQADPEFVPPILPPEVQDDVDEVPELLSWQTNPNQTMFTAAVQMDNYLRAQPAWANKPQADRFAEVVRRVKQDAGISEQPTKQRQQIDPKAAVQAAVQAAPRRKPASLSDLTGGLPQPEASTLEAFQRAKSDDEILAILDRLS
jgi:hypothetical protein